MIRACQIGAKYALDLKSSKVAPNLAASRGIFALESRMSESSNVVEIQNWVRPKLNSHIVRKRNDKANRAFYIGPPDDLSMGQADPAIEGYSDSGDVA